MIEFAMILVVSYVASLWISDKVSKMFPNMELDRGKVMPLVFATLVAIGVSGMIIESVCFPR